VVDEDPHAGALDPFRAAIAAGVKTVMSAHIVATALDSVPATISPRVMTLLLRRELGFDGLVITDGLEMRAIGDGVGIAQGAVAALAAGCDLLCIGGGLADEHIVDELHEAIVAAVRSGRLQEARLADAAQRIDKLAAWRAAQGEAASPHRELGLEAARRAISAENLEPIGDDVAVVRLSSTPSQAAGVVPWGVAAPLAALGVRVTAIDVDHEPADAGELVARTGGRKLVLAARNLHRLPWQRATVEAVLARRPDTVLLEMGLPACRPRGTRAYVATYGAARVCGLAAAEVLTGTRA
jgi:beta-N-acetylhexosaminidase